MNVIDDGFKTFLLGLFVGMFLIIAALAIGVAGNSTRSYYDHLTGCEYLVMNNLITIKIDSEGKYMCAKNKNEVKQ